MQILGSTVVEIDNGSASSASYESTFTLGHSTNSSFSRPTMQENRPKGLDCRYLKCEFNVMFVVAAYKTKSNYQFRLYAAIHGGKIYTDSMPNASGNFGWPKSFLCASLTSFQLYPSTSDVNKFNLWIIGNDSKTSCKYKDGKRVYNNGSFHISVFFDDFGIYCKEGGAKAKGQCKAIVVRNKNGDIKNWKPKDFNRNPYDLFSNVSSTFPKIKTSTKNTVSNVHGTITEDQLENFGFTYIGNLESFYDYDSLMNGKISKADVYVGGMCLFNEDVPEGSGSVTSRKVTVTFDTPISSPVDKYFPLSRCGYVTASNGTKKYGYRGLNRNGYSSKAEGLFRYSNSTWNSCLNTDDGKSNDDVYIYDSSTWTVAKKEANFTQC